MSLYDDIGLDKKDVGESKTAEWSSSFKLMQTQLQAKKVSAPLMQNQKRKVATSLAPVVDLKRPSSLGGGGAGGAGGGVQQSDGEIRFNPLTGRMETVREPSAGLSASPAFYGATNAPFAGISNEYDPQYPNEYEEFAKRLRDKRRQEKDEERRRDDEERARRRRERHKLSGYNGGDREDEDKEDRRAGRSGAAIAPPSVLLEDTAVGKPGGGQDPIPGGSVASKIMAKMGYRSGQGLGKEGQGMSMALQVEKVSKRGGKIIHEKDLPKDLPPPLAAVAGPPAQPVPAGPPMTNADLLRNPSKVLLLTNMVGPGEVDAELQPETAEECSKYGKVNSCVIYELPDVHETEAVRIFVEFDSIPSAIKAAIDTNGRYFGGRVVRSAFYDVDKFKNYQLADDPL